MSVRLPAHDLVIVGAGPVGLFAAYYAGFRGLRVALVDAQSGPGGQIAALYPAKLIHDVPGFPAVSGGDLVAGLVTQAREYAPSEFYDSEVLGLARTGEEFELAVSDDRTLPTRSILLATGVGGIKPRPLPVGNHWYGRGLSFVVTDTDQHAGHHVVVVGGGDSALDWALQLRPVAASVTIVHRRRAFRAHQALLDRATSEGVLVLTDTEVVDLSGDERLREVTVQGKDGGVRVLPADTVIGALGLLSNPTPFVEWGVDVEHRKAVVDTRMRTSVAGIFAAGDAATYPGKVPLIVAGFGEAATAVNNAAVYLDPDVELMPGHSTDPELAPPAGLDAGLSS